MANTAQAEPVKALFELSVGGSRFTIQVQGRRAIEEARRILRKKQSPLIIGRVVRSRASYNRGWAFHLEPKSIRFADLSVATCDAAPKMIEKHLEQVGDTFLPGAIWCPWQGALVREVKRKS